MNKPLKGATMSTVIYDDLIVTPSVLYQYQRDLLSKTQNCSVIMCSTRKMGKTQASSVFNRLMKTMAWEIRAKHHNAPVKVQFS